MKNPLLKRTSDETLTAQTYFTSENNAITRSKVETFLRSKALYRAMYIERSYKREPTPSMKLGSVIDALLSGEPIPYERKVLKRDDPDLFEDQKLHPHLVMSDADMDKAFAVASYIEVQPFYQWYEQVGSSFQHLLKADLVLGRKRALVAGLADVFTLHERTIYIDDFKFTNPTSIKHWFHKCQDFGYFRQLGLYKALASVMYEGQFDRIVCRHIVFSVDQDMCVQVKLLIIPDELLVRGLQEFMDGATELIKTKKNAFFDTPIHWSHAQPLTYASYNFVEPEDNELSDSVS